MSSGFLALPSQQWLNSLILGHPKWMEEPFRGSWVSTLRRQFSVAFTKSAWYTQKQPYSPRLPSKGPLLITVKAPLLYWAVRHVFLCDKTSYALGLKGHPGTFTRSRSVSLLSPQHPCSDSNLPCYPSIRCTLSTHTIHSAFPLYEKLRFQQILLFWRPCSQPHHHPVLLRGEFTSPRSAAAVWTAIKSSKGLSEKLSSRTLKMDNLIRILGHHLLWRLNTFLAFVNLQLLETWSIPTMPGDKLSASPIVL